MGGRGVQAALGAAAAEAAAIRCVIKLNLILLFLLPYPRLSCMYTMLAEDPLSSSPSLFSSAPSSAQSALLTMLAKKDLKNEGKQ